jgi:CCR4-NOT transcription complex subunit 2
MPRTDRPSQDDDPSHQRATDSASQSIAEENGPEIQDPLSNMNEIDKWGLKGFSYMMNNFPDYAMLVAGTEMSSLGFDLASTE